MLSGSNWNILTVLLFCWLWFGFSFLDREPGLIVRWFSYGVVFWWYTDILRDLVPWFVFARLLNDIEVTLLIIPMDLLHAVNLLVINSPSFSWCFPVLKHHRLPLNRFILRLVPAYSRLF